MVGTYLIVHRFPQSLNENEPHRSRSPSPHLGLLPRLHLDRRPVRPVPFLPTLPSEVNKTKVT